MRKRNVIGNTLMALGLVLLLGAAGFIAHNREEDRQSGLAASEALEELQQLRAENGKDGKSKDKTLSALKKEVVDPNKKMPTYEIAKRFYIGTLSMPTIDIELPVLAEWNYDGLNIAPCLYTGSVYGDDMILCGHNYDSHFGRLAALSTGDMLSFTDAEGTVCSYTVSQIDTIGKYDVDAMTSGDWDLTLFTCTIGGVQRVTVRCAAVK